MKRKVIISIVIAIILILLFVLVLVNRTDETVPENAELQKIDVSEVTRSVFYSKWIF